MKGFKYSFDFIIPYLELNKSPGYINTSAIGLLKR